MTNEFPAALPLLSTNEAHACSCCSPAGAAGSAPAADGAVSETFGVQGMTCSHCVSSVTEELSSLPGVTGVAVDLNAGGVSQVTVSSDLPIDRGAVSAAVDEAGYSLASA